MKARLAAIVLALTMMFGIFFSAGVATAPPAEAAPTHSTLYNSLYTRIGGGNSQVLVARHHNLDYASPGELVGSPTNSVLSFYFPRGVEGSYGWGGQWWPRPGNVDEGFWVYVPPCTDAWVYQYTASGYVLSNTHEVIDSP